MKFLDLNGLKHLLKFIDRTVSATASSYPKNSQDMREIPFITNHQIINVDKSENVEVFNWFKRASKGGILEIVFTEIEGCIISCREYNKSYIRKMALSQSHSPYMATISFLNMTPFNYARLIKLNENTLFLAEFVENKYSTSS